MSLYNHKDYARANVPMLPVTAGIEATKNQILLYTVLLVALSLVPSIIGMVTWVYGCLASVLGAGFLILAWRVKRQDTPKTAMQLFGYSIIYLFILFLGMTLDRMFL